MARATIRHFGILAVAALVLAGCEKGTGPFATKPEGGADATAGAAATPQKSTLLVDRDVEAPEVFQVTDDALWDGRPSLGGVWVASPDTVDPERVIMRNPANGKFVIGALFRRERDNPGPKLQISSDAAAALGLLAGAPAKISVTALRREEAPEPTPETPILDSAETVDGAAVAAAPGAIDAGGVETVALDDAAAAPKGKKAKKDKSKKAIETEAIATAALDAATDPAAAGKKTPEAAPVAVAPAPAAPVAAPASGGRPIQIGFFSVEANAKRAVDTLAKAGIGAEMRKEEAKGKAYWTVTARGDAALLKKIKAAGFGDAYLLK